MERAAHILIVDHGSLAFEGAARLLRAEGLAVTRAGGVQEALQIAHDRPLDLILVGDVSLAAGESEGLRREAALAGATLIAHCDESPSWADVTLSARATDRDLLVLVTTLLRLRRADAAAARAQEYERACLDLQHRERAWRETERALRDRTTELRDLNALTMRIGGALSLDEVVRASLDGIAQSLSPDLIVIYARQQDRLVLLGEHSSEDVAWHRTRSVHHVGQCLCGLAAQQGHAVYSRDLASDPRCTLAECREAGLHAFAALPLTAEGEQWGVLGIASVRARDYRPMESFLEAIAGSVALGIRSALLHGQLEERVRELRASEARLSEAQRIARLGHWEYDRQKDELHWSDELYRIWQRDPARFAPTVERFLESIHPDDRAQVMLANRAALDRDGVFEVEHRILLPGGGVRVVRERAAVTYDPDGALLHMVGTAQDITTEKQVEQALSERLEFERLIADLSTHFQALPHPGEDGAFEQALERVTTWLRCDGSALLAYSKERDEISLLSMWVAEGVDPAPMAMIREGWAAIAPVMRSGEVLTLALDRAPFALLADFRGWIEQIEQRSVVVAPLLTQDRLMGVLACGAAHDGCGWPPALNSRLLIVGQVFANALAHRQAQQELAAYRDRLEQLVETRTAELQAANAQLGRAARDLEKARDDLAERVDERTAELAQANQELVRRNQDLSLLNRAAQAFNSILDLDQVLAIVIKEVRRALDVVATSIWLIDPNSERLVCHQATGLQSEFVQGRAMRVGQGIVGWVASTGQSTIVPDTRRDPRHYAAIDLQAGLELRSILAVPLQARQRVVGVIEVLHQPPGRFGPGDLALLELLASSAGVAVDNARLYRMTEEKEQVLWQQNRELAALNAIANTINREVAVGPLLQDSLDQVLELADAMAGWIALLDPNHGQDSRMLAWRGLPPEMRDSPVLGPGAALLQRLIQTRGAVCTTIDAAQVPGHPVHLRQELAWTLIPVQAREGVLGVLHLIRAPEPPLSARAIQILVSIGNQIGLALDNRRLLEETSQMDLLREADRLRSELIANASHELRTPLGLIKVFSTALLMDELSLGPEKQAEFVQGIAQETANLEGIVDNLLDLGRMESGQLRLDRRRIDLSLLARKAAAEIEPILDGHRLARELADGPLWAEVDPRRIEQVLRNLLTNAKKYSPPGSEIALRTARVDQEIVICVQDEGIGIAPQDQERIFERFYRADNEVTRRVRGAGLGLSICKWIAEAHGGEIRVQSALQRGSTFCLALPAAEDAPEAQ